ncbi:MAG: N-6 DNA methylase [Candidatus Nomurabacteria bacterium]|jgi:adenine-specific DNA-methyltransferase|nr:N-6 DNA methylase [Candidatus Nomurabacteria bacterium]
MTNKIKHNGEIFTPSYLVKNMLDFVGYVDDIEQKHIIDNSCGEGAFLIEIVDRYCRNSTNKKYLKQDLEKYIHGIELDKNNALKCLENLDKIAEKYGLKNVKWDIKNRNTLEVSEYNRKMDFVVGNPPYVRVHNLNEKHKSVKDFSFSSQGMTDLYITFYEIGFNMLNENGRMCLITPSSWLSSKSGAKLRQFINENRTLQKVIDIGHFQPFDNAMTYTLITCFDQKNRTDSVDYYVYDGDKKQPIFVDKLNYDDFMTADKMFFGAKNDLQKLSMIDNRTKNVQQDILEVKNGFATLADSIFIGDIKIEDELVIDAIKASTGRWTKIIFPYDKNSKPLSEDEISKKHGEVYEYLLQNKEKLLNRSIANKNEWYLFGRTQAINDVNKPKIAINTIIKDIQSIKLNKVAAGQGIYSGLYILYDGDYSDIEKAILSDDFVNYVKSLKKYKSGGYYTFSSRDLKNYLSCNIEKIAHRIKSM